MHLFLDDVCKAGDAAEQGDQVGGQYLRRIVTGTTKDGRPQYRYLRSKEEVAAYETQQKNKKGGKDKEKDKDKKEDTLKEKLSDEQKRSKEKLQRDPTLFLKDKTQKSLPLYLED